MTGLEHGRAESLRARGCMEISYNMEILLKSCSCFRHFNYLANLSQALWILIIPEVKEKINKYYLTVPYKILPYSNFDILVQLALIAISCFHDNCLVTRDSRVG